MRRQGADTACVFEGGSKAPTQDCVKKYRGSGHWACTLSALFLPWNLTNSRTYSYIPRPDSCVKPAHGEHSTRTWTCTKPRISINSTWSLRTLWLYILSEGYSNGSVPDVSMYSFHVVSTCALPCLWVYTSCESTHISYIWHQVQSFSDARYYLSGRTSAENKTSWKLHFTIGI